MGGRHVTREKERMKRRIMKAIDKELENRKTSIALAINEIMETTEEHYRLIFDKSITNFYKYKTHSYDRHGEGVGTRTGFNLYNALHIDKKISNFLGRDIITGISYDINGDDILGGYYQTVAGTAEKNEQGQSIHGTGTRVEIDKNTIVNNVVLLGYRYRPYGSSARDILSGKSSSTNRLMKWKPRKVHCKGIGTVSGSTISEMYLMYNNTWNETLVSRFNRLYSKNIRSLRK